MNARDREGRTPLILFCMPNKSASFYNGDECIPLLNELIQAGADVRVQDKEGKTALAFAACHHRPEVLDVLVKAGGLRNVRDKQGITPLMYAALYHNQKVLTSLIKAGADVNERTEGVNEERTGA